ncbi:hypothetical protein [Flaviflexus ciconiae]|uniref:hypothetical protein n=1 Tax=Flaviflexus ciconiae TaxID=2496867 RepID=UPI001D17DD03|nr:hypothetical protein [Flaviflexus ciconiae]
MDVAQQRTQLLHALDQGVPLGQQLLAIQSVPLLRYHEVVHVHLGQAGEHGLGEYRIDGLALAGEVELFAAAVRRLLPAVRPRDERRTALPAQADSGQEVLRLVVLPGRPTHVVLQLRHRGPPRLFATMGGKASPCAGYSSPEA